MTAFNSLSDIKKIEEENKTEVKKKENHCPVNK